MQLHELKRTHPNKDPKRVGRGDRRGKTSGRGHKGQKSRAGTSGRPQIRDTIKKIPKLRGFQFSSVSTAPHTVNVDRLEALLASDTTVTPRTLVEHGLIKPRGGKMPNVKILGDGTVSKRFTIEGCMVSQAAREKIEQAGGSVSA